MPAIPDEPHDPAQVMDELARATLALGIRSTWEIANRRSLLWAHALWSLWIGVQIAAYGGPGNIERAFGVWTRPALAVAALGGALLLIGGLRSRPRHIGREIAGLITIGVWDGAMFLGMVGARIGQGDLTPRWLLDPQPLGYVVGYPTGVYGLLATLIIIHLTTLTILSDPTRLIRLRRKLLPWTRD